MNEDKIRALVREEIGKAFTLLARTAEDSERSYWYESGADMKCEALGAIRDVADKVATEASPTPDPLDGLMAQVLDTLPEKVSPAQLSGRLSVNPFAPKRTAQQWADEIRGVILRAEADGYTVWFDFGIGGLATEMSMNIGTEDSPANEDPTVWGPK